MEKKGTLLLLSGPEPQRTALESLLLAQRSSLPGPVTLVRGNKSASPIAPEPDLQIYPEVVDPAILARLLAQHRYVICRPGHSTLSDLFYSGARFGVISTPGQPEQQYLASRLAALGIAPNQPQEKLNLSRLIADIDKFTGFKGERRNSLTTLWQNVLNAL
jgi:UDP:flavonoid glycosyltransferase YjiC (YdhE family)